MSHGDAAFIILGIFHQSQLYKKHSNTNLTLLFSLLLYFILVNHPSSLNFYTFTHMLNTPHLKQTNNFYPIQSNLGVWKNFAKR